MPLVTFAAADPHAINVQYFVWLETQIYERTFLINVYARISHYRKNV